MSHANDPADTTLWPSAAKTEKPSVYTQRGRRLSALTLLGIVALTACSGPNEKAGREQDKAAATAQGQAYTGEGPNQRIGEARDRASAAEQNVRDAEADALKAEGRNLQRQAEIGAARLDEKSRAIREAANKQAEDLNRKANEARN